MRIRSDRYEDELCHCSGWPGTSSHLTQDATNWVPHCDPFEQCLLATKQSLHEALNEEDTLLLQRYTLSSGALAIHSMIAHAASFAAAADTVTCSAGSN